jgi:DNA-nicking Smr family endonuclease
MFRRNTNERADAIPCTLAEMERVSSGVGKKTKGFNTPFAGIDKKVALPEKPRSKANANANVSANVNANENDLFATEMSGVAPLVPDPRGRLGAPEPSATPRSSRRAQDDAEAYAQLADLVDGAGAFDIADTDEHMEGLAPGIDRRLLQKLKRGEYALQGHLDLHGMTAEEARGEVERFVDAARNAGKRCILVIHGRGHHSKEGVAVLKERLKVWLSRGRIAKSVLAFATARPADGGAGAVYILLRK